MTDTRPILGHDETNDETLGHTTHANLALLTPQDSIKFIRAGANVTQGAGMPWTEPLANPNELRRCIRDLVALSTLPAGWENYDMRQIGGSIVAALVSMLDADFVFIALPDQGDQIITELARGRLAPEGLKRVQALLQREKATLGSGKEFILSDPSDGRDLPRRDRADRVRRRCNTYRRLPPRHVSDQNREAAPEYRGQSSGDRLPPVAGRHREKKVYGGGTANHRFRRIAERPGSVCQSGRSSIGGT